MESEACRWYLPLWQRAMDARGRCRRDYRVQLHALPSLRSALGLRTTISGATTSYVRGEKDVWSLEILFCPKCGCVLCWRGRRVRPDGSRRMAVNVRLAPPEAVADLRIEHFDSLDKFAGLPSDGSCVRDLWF